MSADVSQERRLVALSNGCSTVMTSSSNDSLMSAIRRSNFLFVLSSIAWTTAGLPLTTSSTTAVTPQQGARSPRYYRKICGEIRGISAVIAVLTTSPLPCSCLFQIITIIPVQRNTESDNQETDRSVLAANVSSINDQTTQQVNSFHN